MAKYLVPIGLTSDEEKILANSNVPKDQWQPIVERMWGSLRREVVRKNLGCPLQLHDPVVIDDATHPYNKANAFVLAVVDKDSVKVRVMPYNTTAFDITMEVNKLTLVRMN